VAKDPYKLLGVQKSASDAEIRKAYRALAKKLHPDVNPGDKAKANQFKEVTAAYTLLTDKALRRQYDSGQVDASGQAQNPFSRGPFGGSGGGGGFSSAGFGGMAGGQDDMSDLFASLFGMNMGRQTGGPRRSGYAPRPSPKKGADVRYKVKLDFFEAIKGGKKKIKAGQEQLNVTIPEGVEDGAVLRLRGKGHAGRNGGRRGDAKIEISVADHKYFRRDGKNLRLFLPISLSEAILGAKVKISVPAGAVSLNIPAGSDSRKTLRLKGKGVAGGDLFIVPQIFLTHNNDTEVEKWAKNQNDSDGDDIRREAGL
jgi:DnaJ-class molecular chaperone